MWNTVNYIHLIFIAVLEHFTLVTIVPRERGGREGFTDLWSSQQLVLARATVRISYNTREFITSACMCMCMCVCVAAIVLFIRLTSLQLCCMLSSRSSEGEEEREKNRQPVVNYRTQYNTTKAAGAEASHVSLPRSCSHSPFPHFVLLFLTKS